MQSPEDRGESRVLEGHCNMPCCAQKNRTEHEFSWLLCFSQPLAGKKINECRMINPGELAGQFNKPTFAVYDTETDNLELKILEKL